MRFRAFLAVVGCLLVALLVPSLACATGVASGNEGTTIEGSVPGAPEDVEFVYLDSGTVGVGEAQSVVVGFSVDVADSCVELVNLGNDTTMTLEDVASADGAYLFQASFDAPAAYRVATVRYRLVGDDDGSWRSVSLDEGASGSFRVSDATSVGGSLSLLGESGDALDVTFSALGTDGRLVETGSLGELLPASSSGIDLLSGNFVVVLDPGHGGYDGGASANGLVEKDLNLAIALYCQQELESYPYVDVYLTRSTDVALGSTTSSDLLARADYAAQKNADLFVSIHINAGGGKGAEVWIPNDSSWYYSFHEIGDELGDRILDKLSSLGLANRGNKDKDYGGGVSYSDGSPADYLSVIRNCRLNGIPAVLVENGFIDSASDAAFLSSDTNLRALGVAIARSIDEQFDLHAAPTLYGLSDVSQETPHYSEIGWLVSAGITTGIPQPDGTYRFQGEGKVTRGQMAAFLYRLAGSPSFTPSSEVTSLFSDVKAGSSFSKEIWWLAANGIDEGYSNGTFGAGSALTREEMASMLRRFTERFIDPTAKDWASGTSMANRFSDVSASNPHAEDIWWLASVGVTTGYPDGRFGCTDTVIRQDMAALLYRVNGLPAYVADDDVKGMLVDVSESTSHANEIWWLASQGITTGIPVGDGTYKFQGEGQVTRGQMAAFLYRLAGSPSFIPSSSDKARFSDVGEGTLFSKEIWWLASTGIANGYPDGRFGVDDYVVRKDMAAFLHRFYNTFGEGDLYANWSASSFAKCRFSDVNDSTSHSADIWWLAATGITNGYPDGRFGGDDTVIRQDMAAFLYRLDVLCSRTYGGDGADEGSDTDSGTDADSTPITLLSAETYSIMGPSRLSAEQMVAMYRSTGKRYPSDAYASKGAATIEGFVRILCEEASAEGVRAEVVFCQSMKETGWLQYGGQVKVEQCNFAGIGAVNGGAEGATFPDVRTGVRAQVQHLKAYASTVPPVNEIVDPRYHLVKDPGSCPMLADLNGKWAVPGTTYGQEIFALIQRCAAF